MIQWIKNHCFGITLAILLSIFPIWIAIEIIHYNLEPESKVYVEWTVYDGLSKRNFHGTYEMIGKEFTIQNYWQSTGKHGGSYRVVRIVDKDAFGSYINKQSVCIYTGINDIEVTNIKILKTKY